MKITVIFSLNIFLLFDTMTEGFITLTTRLSDSEFEFLLDSLRNQNDADDYEYAEQIIDKLYQNAR
jgi:hypothetical protein